MATYLFSGYGRLPQEVSHHALSSRLGIAVEIDETGQIVRAGSTLLIDCARDFLSKLLDGMNVVSDREEIEALIRYRYHGDSQGALVSAMRRIFEAVDRWVIGMQSTRVSPF